MLLRASHRLLNRAGGHQRPQGSPPFVLLAVLAAVLVFTDDFLSRRADRPFLLVALTDEPAHALTALLAIGALIALRPRWWGRGVWLGALLGGMLIDLDHVPAALGWEGISIGTDRPYSHSLLTLGLLIMVTLPRRGMRRRVGLASVVGLVSHYLRDLTDGSTMPLLWPVTKRGFSMPYAIYAASMVICVGVIVACWRKNRDEAVVVSPGAEHRPPRR